ncbi:peptide chain release factor N(5)-glutamine methyltransferase [Alphaproteobacteria bacterium]|nr:peptide chain release factor N(5)-glutamine methyltransferase [Alphaproteobacteria bacterium]
MNKKKIDVYSLIKWEVEKLKKIGNKTASLDCRLLLSKVLKKTNTVYTHQEVYISQNQIIKFQTLVKKRQEGQPVSRILNRRNFWKRDFILDKEILDPRPDSEIIIESVLGYFSDKTQLLKILDLGSGSGCLGLSLLEEYENASITFVDASKKSLKIVKRNSLQFKLKGKLTYINLDWHTHDWDTKLLNLVDKRNFDIIITNPPYIPSNEIKFLETEVKDYEPIFALDGGNDGLDAYRSIIPKFKNLLKPDGKIFVEIGNGQENLVSKIGLQNGLLPVECKKDLSNINRVVVFNIK